MSIRKTEAVVLKGWKMGETSKILSLYTRDFGKIRAVAKGARGLRSKFKGCLEPLTHIGIVYYDKRTRDLQLLSSAYLIDPHLGIIGDIKRTTLGLAAAELVERAVAGEEPHTRLFDLLTYTLGFLGKTSGFLEGVFWFFESHFINLMGYKPRWSMCLMCGKSLGIGGAYFQPQNGGLLCSECGRGGGGLVVESETLEILYWLQKDDINDVEKLDPTPAQKSEIRKMFDIYFKTHIEHMRSLKSLALYYELENGDKEPRR